MTDNVSLKLNPVSLVIEQGISDDGSINADVEVITEDQKKDGGLAFTNLSDCPKTLVGYSGKVPVVNEEETALEWSDLKLSVFTSLADTFASYKGKAGQVVIVDNSESGLTTVNISKAELKYFSELADVGSVASNPGKLLKVSDAGTGEITYVDGSQFLEDIPGLIDGDSSQETFYTPNITVDKKGRIVAISSSNAATTNNTVSGGVVYSITNPEGEGKVLRSTEAMQVGQVITKINGLNVPTADYLTSLYSTSKLKPRLQLLDEVGGSTTDTLAVLTINATAENELVFSANGTGTPVIHFQGITYIDQVQSSAITTDEETLMLGSAKTLRVDTSRMPDNKYKPEDPNDLLTVEYATSILKQQVGGNILCNSTATSIDVSKIEYNTQFLIGSVDGLSPLKILANKYIKDCSIRIVTSFESGLQLWLGAYDSVPVSHDSISGAYGKLNLSNTPLQILPVLETRYDDTELYGLIYNPSIPAKTGIYRGDYTTLQELQDAYPTDTEGNYAEVGISKATYVYSTEKGWIANNGVGSMLVWISYEF